MLSVSADVCGLGADLPVHRNRAILLRGFRDLQQLHLTCTLKLAGEERFYIWIPRSSYLKRGLRPPDLMLHEAPTRFTKCSIATHIQSISELGL